MPTLVTEQNIVHYETYGRGRPVILLHGWLGSWALWRHTIEELSNEFRTYALDFFGFGDSLDRSADFSVNNFVELVSQFMDRLGINKAPLIGHSMGGTVALGAATRYPKKVVKVAVIGSPIVGSSLNIPLKLSGYKNIARLVFTMPLILDAFIWALTHLGTRDGRAVHRMVKADASKVTVEAFSQSIGTLRETDLRGEIGALQMPVMGIYGRRDIIVSPKQSALLKSCVPHSRIEWFDRAGHFPMIDEPDRFHLAIRDFLNSDS